MAKSWTPEQRTRYYENARKRAAERAIAAGRVPGKKGQPSKNRTAEEKRLMHNARSKKYRDENLEKMRAYKREWERHRAAMEAIAAGRSPGKSGPAPKHATNESARAAQNARVKRYYHANLEKSRLQAAKREREKRAAIKAGTYNPKPKRKTTLGEKRAIKKMHAGKRRAVLQQRGAILVTPQVARTMRWRQNGLCPVCLCGLGEHDIHVDHWIPLSKGGDGGLENLRLLHGACNLKKGTKHPDELRLVYETPLVA